MPRKTSQRSAAIAEAKNEGSAPRRSGRAVTKPETTTKEASRSRRSSTAAQTAASVADSKTPRAKGSSRRDSTSPSEDRPRTREAPTRVKSARRSTGRINYKESDGEEEVSNTKFDENFASGDDLEESESDEKSKTRGRSRSAKSTPKSAQKSKGSSRSRRGRPSKKKEDDEEEEEEENETFDVSDDSNEPEEVPAKKSRAAKAKEPAKPARNRRQKAEVTEVKTKPATEEKSRQSRRSGRGSTNKEESPKKRPTRGGQAKRYAEDDDDEIEEISDSKGDEEVVEMKETEGGRKRKRGASPEEANKRLKDADAEQNEEESKEPVEKEEEDISEKEKEPEVDKKSIEEPMEVDVSDSPQISETEKKADKMAEEKNIDSKEEEKGDQTDKAPADEKIESESAEEKMEQEDIVSAPKEKITSIVDKKDDIESTSKEEKTQASDSVSAKKIELSPECDASQKVKEVEKIKETDVVKEVKSEPPKVEKAPQPSLQPSEQKKEKDNLPPAPPLAVSETSEKVADNKVQPAVVATVAANSETPKIEKVTQEEKKVPSAEETPIPSVTPVPVTLPKESVPDSALNGAEQSSTSQKIPSEVHNVGTPNVNLTHTENSMPKANGAHNDVQHTNSPLKDQYYLLPGRKYVINSKLNESVRQSLTNKMFGFVSFNLGTPDSDAYLQKDKLLSELSKLDAHVICLQQVAKPFYNAVLEPNLDALGFKSIFSQPQDSLKGMATFFKSSLFKLSGKSDISLRELVEKEIEASPLDSDQKAAVKSHIRKCGSVLFTHFSTVMGQQTITVANVQIPRSDFSSHALQISCLAQEIVRINGGTDKPLLLGGEFNIAEKDAAYQLLTDGYLSNEMIEELQKRKDVVLPDNKHDSLVNLLWKSFQHPSSNLCSCYHAVLDHEFIIPELKTASPDLLWFSSDSLKTVGVLDVVSDKTGDHHLSLKADIAFSI